MQPEGACPLLKRRFGLSAARMDRNRIEQALARLTAAVARAETAGDSLVEALAATAELAGLQERHSRLKQTVTQSLRQLDEILAGMPQ
jgi:hypothetical protein